MHFRPSLEDNFLFKGFRNKENFRHKFFFSFYYLGKVMRCDVMYVVFYLS